MHVSCLCSFLFDKLSDWCCVAIWAASLMGIFLVLWQPAIVFFLLLCLCYFMFVWRINSLSLSLSHGWGDCFWWVWVERSCRAGLCIGKREREREKLVVGCRCVCKWCVLRWDRCARKPCSIRVPYVDIINHKQEWRTWLRAPSDWVYFDLHSACTSRTATGTTDVTAVDLGTSGLTLNTLVWLLRLPVNQAL